MSFRVVRNKRRRYFSVIDVELHLEGGERLDMLLRFEDAIDGTIFERIGFAVIGTAYRLCAVVPPYRSSFEVRKSKKRNTGWR